MPARAWQGGIAVKAFLAVTPEHLPTLRKLRCTAAHVAYAIDEQGQLTRATALPTQLRGGVMVLSQRHAASSLDAHLLSRAVLRECAARRFSAVVADVEAAPVPTQLSFWRTLAAALAESGRRLYLPEELAAEHAGVLVCSAVSGGTLRSCLNEAVRHYGAEWCMLDCQRLMMDFSLPCPSGLGTPLTREALHTLHSRCGSATFFSSELGARYFTYRARGETHLVLYDDAQTLRAKLRLGEELGIRRALFQYPEVCDLLPQLFS